MKRAYVLAGLCLAVFGCILYVNAYSEVASSDMNVGDAVRILPSKAVPADNITVKSAGGKFGYKDPNSNNAQQVMLVTAECNVQSMGVSNLNQLSYITFQSGPSAKAPVVDEGFYINSTGISSKGDKLKQKFFPWNPDPPKSGGSIEKYAYGGIKGMLKDGKFIFNYSVKLKNQNNTAKLQELDQYNYVRNTMQTGLSHKSSISLQTAVTLTPKTGAPVTFNDTSAVGYNAKKTSASAKLIKPTTK